MSRARAQLRSWLFAYVCLATCGCSSERSTPEPLSDAEVPHTDGGTQSVTPVPDAEPPPDAATSAQAPDWADALRVPLAKDESADPDVFETHLEAMVKDMEIVPGTKTPVWTYNGGLPGPELRMKRGDRVIVHFTNNLPEPTTIHWHGLRIPIEMDGVPDVSQPAVEPGETFTYDFVVPDAGTFWYHPHVASAAQVGFGLYGAFVVTDPDEPADLGDELTLVLSDMSVDEDGSLQPPDLSGDLGTLFGREGNIVLVNGKVNPVINVRAGRRQRWRIINAARSRYFQLGLANHTFTRIGGDAGFIEHPVQVNTVVVTAAERAEVVVEPTGQAGDQLPVQWIPYDRGFGSVFARPEVTVFRMQITDDEPYEEVPLPEMSREIPPLDLNVARLVQIELTQNDSIDGKFALGINGVPSWEAEPLRVMVGETLVWELKNTIDFAHPFHLHGFFFQVLQVNGVAPAVKEWKDTVDVPVDATVLIAVKFDERPGMWMFHCHILDHADAGMMGMVHLYEHGHEHHDPDAGVESSTATSTGPMSTDPTSTNPTSTDPTSTGGLTTEHTTSEPTSSQTSVDAGQDAAALMDASATDAGP